MAIEVKPFFRNFRPAPELTESYKEELLCRIFLPYSDLHWLNLDRTQQLRQSFMRGDPKPPAVSYEEDWEAKDENNNYMPGNITEEIYWATHFTFPLERLAHIKQLALLAFSTEGEKNFYSMASEFNHTRLFHSYLVGRITELTLRHNGFGQTDINIGIIAGLIHDLPTPPYGDPTKEIDPEPLSEENALQRILEETATTHLEKYGFDKEKALKVVRNEGPIGQILDIADKIAYTAVDLYFYTGDHSFNSDMGQLNPTIEPIRRILRSDSKWANIYQEVGVTDNGEPYFKDHRRLGRFLELRARMHKALYLNPHCRGRDYMLKMLILPLYSRTPDPHYPFNSENLLLYTDYEAGEILQNHWQIMQEDFPFQYVLGVLPDYREVKNPDQIDVAAKQLEKEGLMPIGAETIRRFNPATNFLTVDPKDSQIKPYFMVNPQHAQHLNQTVEACNRTVIYYWPNDEMLDKTWKNLKQAIAKLVELGKEKNRGHLPHFSVY